MTWWVIINVCLAPRMTKWPFKEAGHWHINIMVAYLMILHIA